MGQRHRKKRGPKGTGKPDPSKDRSAHEAARGMKKMALSDLSKQKPTADQIENYPELLESESDRGAAIMAGALLENALETSICTRLVDHGENVRKAWFEGDNAPFRTFADKIQLGLALGIYGHVMCAKLTTVKNIRNQFAHCSVPLGFAEPQFVESVTNLETVPLLATARDPIRTRYCACCLSISKALLNDALNHGGKDITLSFP